MTLTQFAQNWRINQVPKITPTCINYDEKYLGNSSP
jgi:hypothetical protein